MNTYSMSHLDALEAESIHIIREVVAEFKNPVMLYSIGKDSSVMVRLAQKAFFPASLPFPLLHVDTSYKFPEMYKFRDQFTKEIGARLIVEGNQEWIDKKAHPSILGRDKCCSLLKTQALLDALKKHGFDAAFGGARRDEEKSRAKERMYSTRNKFGQWDPKAQRPEVWNLYNSNLNEGESIRVFPLSNWTEVDIWHYIKREEIPIVPIYYGKKRKIVRQRGMIIPIDYLNPDQYLQEEIEEIYCRYRSLGCAPCTGAIETNSTDLDGIIREVENAKKSERENRAIDNTSESAMEQKKREGYF